jgi:hypothetical protein
LKLGHNPCGFCGLDGCTTLLKVKPGSKAGTGQVVYSTCPYQHAKMSYSAAKKMSKKSPHTNVPVHRSICAATVWKYNFMLHMLDKHSTGDELPALPVATIVDIFVLRQEEIALKTAPEATAAY